MKGGSVTALVGGTSSPRGGKSAKRVIDNGGGNADRKNECDRSNVTRKVKLKS